MSAVLVLTHGQAVTAERVHVRAYPVRLRAGATAIACDEATARAIRDALNTIIDDDSRYIEPGGQPLPGGVDGFVPRGPIEQLPPPAPPTERTWGDPSYRTDLDRP